MKVSNYNRDMSYLNVRKKVPHLGLKTSKLHIASFLECYEDNIKKKMDKIVA
jgi:hypothetical protein